MIEKLRTPWLGLVGACVFVLALAACAQDVPAIWRGQSGIPSKGVASSPPDVLPPSQRDPAGAAAEPTTTAGGAAPAVPPAAPPATQPAGAAPRGGVAVRRGRIAEELVVNGRVVGLDETPVSFSVAGVVKTVAVQPGQTVQAGQLLAELDSKQITTQLADARARLEISSTRVTQLQAQAQTRQQESARRQRETERQSQAAITEAEHAFRRATANLEQVMAGPSPAQRRDAEAAVAAARLGLERAKLEYGRFSRGPDPAELATAEGALAGAEAQFAGAKAEFDRLSQGPSPDDIRAAERNVERAQNTLKAAQAAGGDKLNAAEREVAISNAQIGLRDAQDQLAGVRKGPSADQVDIARRKLDAARFGLEAARHRLETLRKGPDELVVAGAKAAVDSAEANLNAALARLDELNGRPRPAELQEAEDKLAAALGTLERAREAAGSSDASSQSDPELVQAEQVVRQDRSKVDALERDLAAVRLVAPFAGSVASVQAQPGKAIEADRPSIVLARGTDPIVLSNLLDADAARLSPGQKAFVQLDGADGTQLSASVVEVARSPTGAGSVARFRLSWGAVRPVFGGTARVRIILQEKEDALLVPPRALRTAGERRYVQYLEGDVPGTAEVIVGIVTADAVEILSGVQEGQMVVVGS